MITNDRQYGITKARLDKFEESIDEATKRGPGGTHLALHRAMIAGLQGQAADLRAALARYDALKSGAIGATDIVETADLGRAAIEARIAAQLTQQELAERVGVTQQQIHKWESSCYEAAGLRTLTKVLKALDARLDGSTVQYRSLPSKTPDEVLVVGSRIEAAIRDAGCNTSGGVIDAVNEYVRWLVTEATARARKEGRDVQPEDLPKRAGG